LFAGALSAARPAMEGDPERFDAVLLNIAQQSGSIDGILDIFFGFLQRKTDFFTGAQSEEAAQEMVLKYYKKHWKAGVKKRSEIGEKNRIADEERRVKAEEKKHKDEEEYRKRQEELASRPKVEEVTDEEAAAIKAKKEKKEEAKDGEDEGEKSDEDSKESPPDGNGGTTDKYTWTQTLGALEVFVPVRPGVKAKQLVVEFGTDTLKIGIKGEPLMIDGKLHAKIKPDDCMWTLVDNKNIQINFEKFDNMKWWTCVVQGDAGINTKKIVPENSKLSDLDGETRMTVEKMMYDQRQKALGKPTSDQEKQHDLLEKFKAAHPEMDFSKAKVNYGGGGMGGGGGGGGGMFG